MNGIYQKKEKERGKEGKKGGREGGGKEEKKSNTGFHILRVQVLNFELYGPWKQRLINGKIRQCLWTCVCV